MFWPETEPAESVALTELAPLSPARAESEGPVVTVVWPGAQLVEKSLEKDASYWLKCVMKAETPH